jgi:hypothetical protein
VLLPNFYFGKRYKVRQTCRQIAKRLLKGRSWRAVVESTEFTDYIFSESVPTISLEIRHRSLNSVSPPAFAEGIEEVFFDAWAKANATQAPGLLELQQQLFLDLTEEAWSTLMLLSQEGRFFLQRLDRRGHFYYSRFLPFLLAVSRAWETYESMGDCFEGFLKTDITTVMINDRPMQVQNITHNVHFHHVVNTTNIRFIPRQLWELGYPVRLNEFDFGTTLSQFNAGIEQLRPYLEKPRLLELDRK